MASAGLATGARPSLPDRFVTTQGAPLAWLRIGATDLAFSLELCSRRILPERRETDGTMLSRASQLGLSLQAILGNVFGDLIF